jgi:hypothetical protein
MDISMSWQHANRWRAGRALCLRAGVSVIASVLSVVSTALRPATAGPQRATALLLLTSLASVAMAMTARLPGELRIVCGVCGAIGLLVSGVAGAYLDTTTQVTHTSPDDSWNVP